MFLTVDAEVGEIKNVVFDFPLMSFPYFFSKKK